MGKQRSMTKFQRRPDSEYALCRSCQRAGYGEDSWLPVTSEFWAVCEGLLLLRKCKACRSEVAARKFGMVTEMSV